MVLAATQEVARDGSDWALLITSLALFLSGTITFAVWTREQLKRPEVRYLWRLSLTGEAGDLRDWPPDEMPSIAPGTKVLVEASIQNVGDQAAEAAMTNFVVPSVLDIERHGTDDQSGLLTSSNGIAGLPPDFGVRFFARERPWPPDMFWMHRFLIAVPDAQPGDLDQVRLLMEVSEPRFNGRGRRVLPRRLAGLDDPRSPTFKSEWPGAHRKHSFRQVRPIPAGRVRRGPGVRQDVRDLRLATPAGSA